MKFKFILMAAVMAFEGTVSAATVVVDDAAKRTVKVSDLSNTAKIIAVDFIGEDDVNSLADGIQTFESLTDSEKSAVIFERAKYIRQLKADTDHVFSLPYYGVYTVFVKEGAADAVGYEIAMNNPDFVTNHTGAKNVAGLEANLTDSQAYMRGELAVYFALDAQSKTAVATRLFENRANDTTKELIAQRVTLFSTLQNIINADDTDKVSMFEENDAIIGHSAFEDKAVYDSADEEFKKAVVKRFISFSGMDSKEEFDNSFSQSIFLEKVKNTTVTQAISQLVSEAKTKFGVLTPRYDNLGIKTANADNAVLGKDYATVAEFISTLEENSTPPKPSNNSGGGGGGGGTVYRENKGDDIEITVPQAPTSTQTPQETAKEFYSDVEKGRWSYEPIYILSKRGVISGNGDGKFRPADSITREEFVKIAISAFSLKDDTATCEFEDVQADSWSYPYIATAKQYSLVSGRNDTQFSPKDGITREEATLIMYNLAQFKNIPLKMKKEAPEFGDGALISDWAREAVVYLYRCSVIDGISDLEFAPKDNITREQTAKLVYTLLKLIS